MRSPVRALPLLLWAVLLGTQVTCRGGATPPGPPSVADPAVPSVSAAQAKRPVESGLQKVTEIADIRGRLRAWRLENALFVADDGGTFFAVVQGDELVRQPALGRGLPPEKGNEDHGSIATVSGTWPDDVWLVWRNVGQWDEWFDRVFRLQAGAWVQVASSSSGYLYLDTWMQEGCLVGFSSNAGFHQASRVTAEHALHCRTGSRPQLAFKGEDPMKYSVVNARGFSTGDLLLLDFDAPHVTGHNRPAPRLWVFEHGSAKPKEVELPLPAGLRERGEPVELLDARLLARSAADAYVVGNLALEGEHEKGRLGSAGRWLPPLLVTFDGTSTALAEPPPLLFISDAVLAGDGTLVLVGGASEQNPTELIVVARAPGGRWRALPLPVQPRSKHQYTPFSVAARSIAEVWVTAEGERGRFAIFRSRSEVTGAHDASGLGGRHALYPP